MSQRQPNPDHQPLLLWIMNNWKNSHSALKAAVEKLDPKNDTLVVDARTKRGIEVATLDPATVFATAKVAEHTAIRQVLSSHPFLYNSKYSKSVAVEVKKHLKKKNGADGVFFIFAIGDAPAHAPDQDDPLPDFVMKIAVYSQNDLYLIADTNLGTKLAEPRPG
jgi:hypothetical protein